MNVPSTETIVYLVRHATPDWSRVDISYHIPPGPPLTLQGISEAEQLGSFLRSRGVRQLFGSPLERCSHTAQLAAQIAGASLEIWEGLRELHPGEDNASLRARLKPAFDRGVSLAAQGRSVGLVTHGGPIAFLLEELGLAQSELTRYRNQYDHRNPLPPAGAWEVSRQAPGMPWRLHLAFVPNNPLPGGQPPMIPQG